MMHNHGSISVSTTISIDDIPDKTVPYYENAPGL